MSTINASPKELRALALYHAKALVYQLKTPAENPDSYMLGLELRAERIKQLLTLADSYDE